MKKLVWGAVILSFLVAATIGISQAQPRTLLKFDSNESLSAIRAKIASNGYSFKVEHNRWYDMSPEEKAMLCGRHPGSSSYSVSNDNGPLEKYIGKTTLPASFDWRSNNGHSYIGPVRNQGDCGACYAFGACATAESSYNIANSLVDGACADFSEAFIAWCLGSMPAYQSHFYGCGGADFDYQELQALVDQGVPNESSFPYSDTNPQACPANASYAARVRYNAWYRVSCNDIDAIKTAIMTYGVVDAAVTVTDAWRAYASGVYEDTQTSCDGSPCENVTTDHAISLVGWDDNPPEGGGGCWILRNSWGADWGENGYMRIRYTSAHVACAVAYVTGPSAYQPEPLMDTKLDKSTYTAGDNLNVRLSIPRAISTPFYPVYYFRLPGEARLYLTLRGKRVELTETLSAYLERKYKKHYVPEVVTSTGAISDYPLFSTTLGALAPGDYTIEGGAVSAETPIIDGELNWLCNDTDAATFKFE